MWLLIEDQRLDYDDVLGRSIIIGQNIGVGIVTGDFTGLFELLAILLDFGT